MVWINWYKFGLGLTGTLPTFEEIQFLDVGIGSIHSLRRGKDKVVGSITRNKVTVVGTGTHGLKNNDTFLWMLTLELTQQ